MSIKTASDWSVKTTDLMGAEEEEEEKINIGLYIGGRNAVGQRHGRGWAILPNGDQYDGQYRHGKRHGMGLYVFENGARYYGQYRCGRRTGRGMFIYPDGTMYEGGWKHNLHHGKGRYKYLNGDTYAGDWYRGQRHGVGVYTFGGAPSCTILRSIIFDDGRSLVSFKGTWRHGQRFGPFEVYFGKGDSSRGAGGDGCSIGSGMILHGGIWDDEYPNGPAVFSFDRRYMLMGFFEAKLCPPQPVVACDGDTEGLEEAVGDQNTTLDGEEEGDEGDECKRFLGLLGPPKWFAQGISIYDYGQLPQQPVPVPLSDSELSICTATSVGKSEDMAFPDAGKGEGEYENEAGPEECRECGEGEDAFASEMETNSQPSCRDPCDIELQPKC